jgi:hypothetical protein
MSQVLMEAIQVAAREAVQQFLCLKSDEGISRDVLSPDVTISHRRTMKTYFGYDFSDEELRMVNEIEKKPGMKQVEIIALMSIKGSGPDEVSCEAATVKVLLANLVKRKVLLASPFHGYRLNDASPPPT